MIKMVTTTIKAIASFHGLTCENAIPNVTPAIMPMLVSIKDVTSS